MNNKSNNNKITEQMQNKIQYSSSNQFNNVHHPVSAKFNSQNGTKVIDQGQGTNSSTQLSSYANLNFDFTNQKPTHQVNSDRTNVVPSPFNQNIEFRNQHNAMNYGFNSNNQKVVKPQRGN
jgi:oligoribonuclease NrnB/cAMP/cGMP phosphodiesterase (DHH superfamily)